ncbi:unnamed protein product [Bathycoccus prasinos]
MMGRPKDENPPPPCPPPPGFWAQLDAQEQQRERNHHHRRRHRHHRQRSREEFSSSSVSSLSPSRRNDDDDDKDALDAEANDDDEEEEEKMKKKTTKEDNNNKNNDNEFIVNKEEKTNEEVFSRFLEDAANAQEKDYRNSMRVGSSKSMRELARYDAAQNMERRRRKERGEENDEDDDDEDDDDEGERWVETENLRSASRMMNTNSANTNNGSKYEEEDGGLNLAGKHQSSFADLNYNSSGSDFARGGQAAPEIYRSLITKRREMEEEEEEEEEEQRRKSDAYFSKHFNSHPYSLAGGGTTGHHFNSIGLGFGGSARELERQRQSQILILQRQKQKQRSLESYDDLKNAKEDTKFFSRQSYTESDFEDDDDDDDDNFDKYEDKEEEEDDDDDDELDDSRSYGDPEIRPMHATMTTTITNGSAAPVASPPVTRLLHEQHQYPSWVSESGPDGGRSTPGTPRASSTNKQKDSTTNNESSTTGTRLSNRFSNGNHSTVPTAPTSTTQKNFHGEVVSNMNSDRVNNVEALFSPNNKNITMTTNSEKTKAKFAALTIDPSRKPASTTTPATTKRSYLSSDSSSVRKSILEHYDYTLARRRYKMDAVSVYEACALSLRDRLVERWSDTQQFYASSEECKDLKMVYYMSLEFLVGRSLGNAASNLGLRMPYADALRTLGHELEDIAQREKEPALGNGGLGRLASCFLDSLATQNYPGWGYGIRYKYGMFEQALIDGKQVELPDYWLTSGNPWEVERLDVTYKVRFYGRSVQYTRKRKVSLNKMAASQRMKTIRENPEKENFGNVPPPHDASNGESRANNDAYPPSPPTSKKEIDETETRFSWEGGEIVVAVAYDTPVPGYGTYNANNMRLWSSKPSHEFDLKSFNAGDYIAAIEQKERGESISSVLYPNDDTHVGKELRLKQQFFFCSATLQDILHQFKKSAARYNNSVMKAYAADNANAEIKSPSSTSSGNNNTNVIPGLRTLKDLPKRVAIQLNDTHPAIGVPEFMRLLLDEELLCWEDAWNITKNVFSYTNHTIMTEAMEKWPVPMLSELLPRHAEIIFEINHRFLESVRKKWPGDEQKVRRMSIVEESEPKMFRMANLAVIGSHTVNGVAEMHTNLVKTILFADFCELGDTKFRNVTNGVTPRRWILQANPKLAKMYTDLAGPGWVNDMKRLEALQSFCDDDDFCERFRAIKKQNKRRVASFLEQTCRLNYKIAPNALFDMQIKRIHEYKRQLLNVLGIIHRFDAVLRATPQERAKIVPRVFIIAGKAAPGYDTARLIIQLACAVAKVVNETPECAGVLTVCFVPNFNVSIAELLIPASDVSQHISLAGTEASGTGNMKFAMNGGLIVGTRDGANVEIARAIGSDNIFQFGATVDEVKSLKKTANTRNPAPDERLANVCAIIHSGIFGDAKKLGFNRLCSSTLTPTTDLYLCGHDFASYLDAQARADEVYLDERLWTRKSVLSALRMAKFSTDRTIKEYAEKIWNVEAKAFLPQHVKERLKVGRK